MGLFNKPIENTIEERNYQVGLVGLFHNHNIYISEESVMKIPVIAESINLIGGAISTLPIHVNQEKNNGKIVRMRNHNIELLLNESCNDYTNASTLKYLIAKDLLLYGKSYVYLDKHNIYLKSMHHVPFRNVTEKDTINETGIICGKELHYTLNNRKCIADCYNFCIIDTGANGILNSSNLLKLMLKHDQTLSSAFDNCAKPSGILQTKGRLTKEAVDRLRNSWSNLYTGNKNAGKTIILEEGLEYKKLRFDLDNLKMLDTKQSFIDDIERLFNLYHTKSDDNLFLKRTLAPILNHIECAFSNSLLLESEKKKGYFCSFDAKEVLKPSTKELYDITISAVKGGIITVEEARSILEFPSFYEDEKSDKLLFTLGSCLVDKKGTTTIFNMGTTVNSNGEFISTCKDIKNNQGAFIGE